MDAPEKKNTPVSKSQEEDDYLFHIYLKSLLSVEEHVSIEELLGKQKPDVSCVQDGSMKDSVEGGRKPELLSCTSSLHLSGSQGHHLSQVPASTERHLGPSEIEVQATKDFTQSSVHIAGEDFCQSTPKRKRKVPKSDLIEEIGSCRNCNCKISKCLKPDCDCFAAGLYCMEPCSCKDCLNKPNEDKVLQTRRNIESHNSHLFDPEVIRTSDSSPQIGDDPNRTPASKLCKTGCCCRKSSCHATFCSCSKGRVGCSINCKCQGCQNIYGRR